MTSGTPGGPPGADQGADPGAPPVVLVANRGEIAVRILRTLRHLGLRSVAVYNDDTADDLFVRAADNAVRVSGPGPAGGYLNWPAIIAAAHEAGATMVHPGYGFLSENADFARACAAAGLVFVGPPPEAIEAMGDKIRAKRTVSAAGVPLLPGFAEDAGHPMSDADLTAAAAEVGYPLLVKPSAGGGGKGMRVVPRPGELAAAAAAARREAQSAFGDATLLIERFVRRPRHIEVQVLADTRGNVVHLGERECSLQRRHQKIVEEAPSPLLSDAQRASMGAAAVAAATACGYVGAGTVEFIVQDPEGAGAHGESRAERGPLASIQADPDAPAPPEGPALWTAAPGIEYAFLEMNTRLQVEHPVTEEITTVAGRRGVDLVELQLRVALGEELPFGQDDLGYRGHAVEARVYAEDPARDFLPTGGPVLLLDEPVGGPGDAVRVDSGLAEGAEITSAYDPMLAKVITWAPDRPAALDRMDAALARYTLLGCGTNTAFLRALLRHPDVRAGRLSTDLTERVRPELAPDVPVPPEVYAAAALDRQLALEPSAPLVDRFDVPDGWRIGEHAWTPWRLRAPGGEPERVAVRRAEPAAGPAGGAVRGGSPVRYEVRLGDADPIAAHAHRDLGGRILVVRLAGRTARYARADDGAALWLGCEGASWRLIEEAVLSPIRTAAARGDGTLRSPMPGTVLSIAAEPGREVAAGEPVLVVEAMKMEHAITAPVSGVLTSLEVRAGQAVAMDMVLAVITPPLSAAPAGPFPAATP